MAKKFKPPKTLGACADMLLALREEKAVAQREVDKLDEKMRAVEQKLIDELPADDAEGVVGKTAKAVILRKTVPTVEAEAWPKVWAYIFKHKATELMQKRINSKAVEERWEAGQTIPGVTKFNVKKVSITKR